MLECFVHTERVVERGVGGDLEYPNGEVCGGLGSEPEPEVWVWSGEFLQSFLQLLQPVDEEVAVLQHQPVTPLSRRLQQLQRHLHTNKMSVCD